MNFFWKGCNKIRFRAIQGHTGGDVIAPELMGHVAIPLRWKEFLFHRGCSVNVKILEAGLIACGEESKEGRQTVFFTPLDPWGDETEHYNSEWKPHQDAVYWIHLARATEKELFLGKQVSCHYCSRFSADQLHRKSGIPERRQNFVSKTLHASAHSSGNKGTSRTH